VSDDTVRRWIDTGRIAATEQDGRTVVLGTDLALTASTLAGELDRTRSRAEAVSARNRMPGIVTAVKKDTVMAQVELMCGPYRVVSLMSREAADELGLEPGVRAIASVKSTNVVVERP
ncbi:MAG: TOBE domain-containing protein, partial [Marmoricola sp.]